MAAARCGIFALKKDGTFWAWDYDKAPKRVGGIASWEGIAAGRSHVFLVAKDGSLWAWGPVDFGELAGRTTTVLPVKIDETTHWESVGAGGEWLWAIRRDGTLWAAKWGHQTDPINAPGLQQKCMGPQWKAVATDGMAVLAVQRNGTLWATTTAMPEQQDLPKQVGSDADWGAVYIGIDEIRNEACFAAIKTDGSLWVWGDGADPLGVAKGQRSPVRVGKYDEWRSVAVNRTYSLGVKTDGTLWCWMGIAGMGDPGE